MKKSVFLFLLLVSFFAFAQKNEDIKTEQELNKLLSNADLIGKGGRVVVNKNKVKELTGSKYLFKEWKKGIIFFDGKKYHTSLNYNVMTKKVDIQVDGSVISLESSNIQKFIVRTDTYKKNNDGGFSKILYTTPDINLLERYDYKIKEDREIPGITLDAKRKIVIKNNIVLVKNGVYYDVKLTKKSISKYLTNKKKTLSFAKKSKLSFKKVRDLAKILDYDSSL